MPLMLSYWVRVWTTLMSTIADWEEVTHDRLEGDLKTI